MSIETSIVEFNIGQFDDIAMLFSSYFPADDKLLALPYTEWLYSKNPFGTARIVKAVDGDRLVGFMALIPVKLVRRNARLVAYYVVNVLVHPEYHGRHVFGRMITVAKDYSKKENAALMGHPNDMALKSWERARMHFHDALTPNWVLPKWRAKGLSVSKVDHISQLQTVASTLYAHASQSERWNIAVTMEYLSWRFLEHPVNRYLLRVMEVHGSPIGVTISKKLRTGLNLLIDQFVTDDHASAGLAQLPLFTVSFKTKAAARELPGSLWPIPVKKKMPFFFTHEQVFAAGDVMNLGLSASDF